jgi:hypothetical protein
VLTSETARVQTTASESVVVTSYSGLKQIRSL